MTAIKPLAALNMLAKLKHELPLYLSAAAQAPDFAPDDIHNFTDSVLKWWRTHGKLFPAWSLAARIVFVLSPNSASCERVFSKLKEMFGDQQMAALSDYIQAALMLKINKRRVG